MVRGATISDDGAYRYELWRHWDKPARPIAFVCLNPSTADAEADDATVRRLIRFTRDWGYGGFRLVNLYGFRATSQDDLRAAPAPVGPKNNAAIIRAAELASLVVVAWGTWPGPVEGRADSVHGMLLRAEVPIRCFGTCANDQPKHPVRLRADTLPQRWPPRPRDPRFMPIVGTSRVR